MRFGVALDLWSKEELESVHSDAEPKRGPKKAPDPPPPAEYPGDGLETFLPDPIDEKQVQRLNILAKELGLDRDGKLAGIAATIGREVTTSKELTKDEATKVIKAMQAGVKRRKEAVK
jgi:hypothetical protein